LLLTWQNHINKLRRACIAGFRCSKIKKLQIVNIPSKNIDGFNSLIKEIENSEIEKVLFVSSTPGFEESSTKFFKIISNQKVKRVLNYEFLYPDLMEI
jgi:hypothetical protein